MSGTYSVVINGQEEGFEIMDVEMRKAAMENVREMVERQAARPADDSALEVIGIRNPKTCARYEYDPRYGMMSWKAITGNSVNMTPEEWRELLEELPEVMKIFRI